MSFSLKKIQTYSLNCLNYRIHFIITNYKSNRIKTETMFSKRITQYKIIKVVMNLLKKHQVLNT